MADGNETGGGKGEAHDRHHAQLRRKRREASHRAAARPQSPDGRGRPGCAAPDRADRLLLYGLHTVRQALANPARRNKVLHVTANALKRLEADPQALAGLEIRETHPRELDRMLGPDAVHQGCVLETEPLQPRSLDALGDCDLVLVLDQVTDPHNVGAIMRSAVAMGAAALITTARHSPVETGVLAKSASGALDLIDHIEVRNLAGAIEALNEQGFQTIGLDSEGPDRLERTVRPGRVALVLGSEGKGLRQKTRETCSALARIDMPGGIKSLNVSNAAILSLYIARAAREAENDS